MLNSILIFKHFLLKLIYHHNILLQNVSAILLNFTFLHYQFARYQNFLFFLLKINYSCQNSFPIIILKFKFHSFISH